MRSTYFNPRAPHGARPIPLNTILLPFRFQSTRPVWGATRQMEPIARATYISIHAPRVGRDGHRTQSLYEPLDFNPCAPCGARLVSSVVPREQFLFQSTRPRGARLCLHVLRLALRHFNPRARVGRDEPIILRQNITANFNPRARVGRDSIGITTSEADAVFQSTRPRGARLDAPAFGDFHGAFQSTRPRDIMWRSAVDFNPRARVGRDHSWTYQDRKYAQFQSTRPRGARPDKIITRTLAEHISIHAPAWGATPAPLRLA